MSEDHDADTVPSDSEEEADGEAKKSHGPESSSGWRCVNSATALAGRCRCCCRLLWLRELGVSIESMSRQNVGARTGVYQMLKSHEAERRRRISRRH